MGQCRRNTSGIDIGGTNLKAGVVDETGTLLSAAKTRHCSLRLQAFVETLAGLSRQAAEAAGIGAEETVPWAWECQARWTRAR